MRYLIAALLLLYVGCASAPPTMKIIDQVAKNEDAIEDIEESELPETVKARVVSAIKDTQKLAVESSQAWEQCNAELADAEKARWKWSVIAFIIGAGLSAFVTRKLS